MKFSSFAPTAIALVAGIAVGYLIFDKPAGMTPGVDEKPKEKEILYWVAPMDADYRRDGPGKSPMGMDLIPFYKEDTSSSGVGFSVDPNVLASLGVKTVKAERTIFIAPIEATGRISYDETRTSHLHVRTEGWVEDLMVRAVGESVKEGELLFKLYSPVIASALSEYGQAASSGSKRLQDLALSRLEALGLDTRTINAAKKSGNWSEPISFYAPQDGVVTKLGVAEGSLSAKNTTAFEITDPSLLWLIADVFESQASRVSIGQPVTIQGTDGVTINASVTHIYPDLDPITKTVRVRMNVPNATGIIRAGQYYQVSIMPDGEDVLSVPSSAVIRLGSGNRVIVAHGDGRFEPAEVVIGASANGRTVIKRGLSEGEDIVLSGQFMMDSESSFSGAALRMADKIETLEDEVVDHSTMDHSDEEPETMEEEVVDHSTMDHSKMNHDAMEDM